MLELFLVFMVVFALLAVQTNILRRAIVYLCVFSLVCSFSYLLYQAPDVAIAEAIIGSTLSTILYLVALKKYKVFRAYYTAENLQMQTNINLMQNRSSVFDVLKKFSLETELELDIIHTSKDLDEIKDTYSYDIIIEHNLEGITLHGDKSNYHFDGLINYITSYNKNLIAFNYIESDRGEEL